jgi:hypothetical protein
MEPFVKIAKDYKLYSETYHGTPVSLFVSHSYTDLYWTGKGFAAARANLDDPTHKAAVSHFLQEQVKNY